MVQWSTAPVSIITSSPSAPSTSGQSSALPLAPPMPVAAPASLQPASFSHAPSPAPAPLSALFTGGLALSWWTHATGYHRTLGARRHLYRERCQAHIPSSYYSSTRAATESTQGPPPSSNLCWSLFSPTTHPLLHGRLLPDRPRPL